MTTERHPSDPLSQEPAPAVPADLASDGAERSSPAALPQPEAEGGGATSDADGGAVTDVEALARELAQVRAELEEKNRQYLRLAADFENFRRRTAQEAKERARYASEAAVRALLPVLDNLRRALDHVAPEDDSPLAAGVRMTVRQFEEALESLGVQPIAAVGEPFDPQAHEAVGGEPSAEVERDTVVAELERGYWLHDRVLRPAKVHVAHPAAVEPASEPSTPGEAGADT